MDRDVSQHYAGIVSKLFDDSRAKFIDEMTRGLDHAYYLANINLCNGIEGRILPPVYQMTDADYYILGEEYRSQITEYVYRGWVCKSHDASGSGSHKSYSNTYACIFYISVNGDICYTEWNSSQIKLNDNSLYSPGPDSVKKTTIHKYTQYPITIDYVDIIKKVTHNCTGGNHVLVTDQKCKNTCGYCILDKVYNFCEEHLEKIPNSNHYQFTKKCNLDSSTNITYVYSETCTCNNAKSTYRNHERYIFRSFSPVSNTIFKHINQVIDMIGLYYKDNRHQLNPTFANIQLLREIEKKQQALTLQTKQAQDAKEESKKALQELADKQKEIIKLNTEAQESADITARINQDTLIKIERDSTILSEKLAAYNTLSSTDAIVDKMKTLVAGTNLVFSDLGNTITECVQHIPELTSANEDLAQKLMEKIAAFNTMRREIVETQRLLYKQSNVTFNMHQKVAEPIAVARAVTRASCLDDCSDDGNEIAIITPAVPVKKLKPKTPKDNSNY